MLKVLIVSVGKLSGGVESYTLILGKMLAENGVEVHYAVRRDTWLDRQLTDVKKIVVDLGNNLFADMRHLKAYVEQYGINIVHCNSNNGLFVSQLIKENSSCKKIGVIHGDVKIDQSHKGALAASLYEKLETWLVKNTCTRCIAVSESIKNILIGRGVPKDILEVVYTGIVPMAYAKRPDYYAKELKVVTVGNLLPVKNQIALLKAFVAARRNYPEMVLTCDIYGEGTERNNLEKYIAENKLDYVTLKGFDKEVRNKLNEYQVYVHTSRYESFGISIVEAMDAGCCILTSDAGGVREIIDPDCGMIIDPNNAGDFAEVLYHCNQNRDMLKQYAEKGRERCQNKFYCTTMLERILGIYRKLI